MFVTVPVITPPEVMRVAVVCIQYAKTAPSVPPAGALVNGTETVPGVVNDDGAPQLVPSDVASFFLCASANTIDPSTLGVLVTAGRFISLVAETALS